MEARERFKVEKYGGDYCDFEESRAVTDAFEYLNPDDYPEAQRKIAEEFNRRAEIGNQRYRIAMYRAEMFEKGFNAGMYICTFDHDENMTGFVFTDETRRLLGYDGLEDLPNEFDSWVKTLLPDQREAMVPIFWNTVKAHRELPDISHAEYPMVRKDGKIIWVTGAGRFIRREDGSLEIYMGCYRDVTAEHEKDDYLHIIEGIGKIFNFSLYIDMAAQTYQIVSTNEYVEKVRKDPNAFRFLRDNVDSSVHPDYRDEMKAWLQPEVIAGLLQNKDTISKDFYSAEAEMWFRGIFMVGDRNEDGSLNHIIYGCQDITYEKKRELAQHARLKKAEEEERAQLEEITALNASILEERKSKEREHGVVEALSASYLNVYVINTAERMVEILKLNGYITMGLSKGKAGPYPYEATCRTYISNRVYGEDQQMVADCMSLDNLLVQLKDKKEYEFTYRVPENGGISWYQGKYVAVDGGFIVCGFQNIDEIVKKEKEQKAELQSAYDRLAESTQERESQFRILDALSKDYTNVFLIDTASGISRAFSLTEDVSLRLGVRKLEEHSYEDACDGYISRRFYREDVPVMTENMKLSRVMRELEDTDEFSGNFRILDNGTMHYYQFKYRKVPGTQYVLLGFLNTDQVMADEIRKSRELEDAKKAAEAANAAKTSFLFNMSHDIRTPMNAIIGFTELLKKHRNEPEKVDDYIGKIQSSGDFLLSLINNVLEMARIESGNTTLDESVFRTGEICEEITSIYTDLMQKKNINFSHSVDCRTKYIYGDTVKIREIWLNIVSNAYKYTPEGGSVSISTIELPSDKEGYARMRTTFKDTGIGMSRDYLNVIFEDFTRERTSTESRVQGTGLGMPIVKKLVDLMGGTITVESEQGRGSTFTVTLMHRIGADPSTKAAENQEVIDYRQLEGKRILLAEDNELNAEIAVEILTDAGFEVEHAADGVICVDMLQKAECGHYDLILMDVQMPNMDGYQAARVIRSMKDPCRNRIPIIAMTANAFDEDKKNAFAAGMDGHLAKPIEISKLMETLAGVLK